MQKDVQLQKINYLIDNAQTLYPPDCGILHTK